MQTPLNLRLAQLLCRCLPPILGQRCRAALYPYRRAKADNFEFSVRAQTGSLFCGNTSEFHAHPFSVQGYFEWRHWAIARALLAGDDVIVEVGANVGTETVGFSDLVGPSGRVIAFEPVPSNLLRLNATLAQCRYRNTTVLPFAVSDHNGDANFVLPPDQYYTGIGYLTPANSELQATTTVQCITLDDAIKAETKVSMIFIDAEGSEPSILRGAQHTIATHQPYIVLEASPKLLERAGTSIEELTAFIARMGYTPYRIGRFQLQRIADKPSRASNWLLLPGRASDRTGSINRMLRACALLPCIGSINPLRT